jgi:hypothetical protein
MVENEIPFLSRTEFRRMAPPILRLEISRLTRLIQTCTLDTEHHNALVKARYEMRQFVACLERADRESVESACAHHLRSALLALSVDRDGLDGETANIISYVIDRIRYVHDRIGLVY